nr:ribonuclease H-like domain-containing protein [Tanacetum cinerariifolium]
MKQGYKARLVANGKSQQPGIDCDETFSPVVKPAIIRTVLSLAVSCQWPIHQLDVKNAFLHGHLTETVYMHQPSGFRDPLHPDYRHGCSLSIIYVNDIILTASSSAFLHRIISSLHGEFAMTYLGPLIYFLGLQLIQKKLGPDGSPVFGPTLYCSIAGALQYLTFTRPDLSYAVQQLCLYMHAPREPYFNAMKRVLRYLRGTTDLGCPATSRSISGYHVFLGDNLLTWLSKRQDTLSRSSAEAEYRGVANAVAETSWLRNLLLELHTPLSTTTLV